MIDLYLLARENYNKTKQILDIATKGESSHWGIQDVMVHLHKNTYTFEKVSPDTLEFWVCTANKMVKHPDCPHNQMNRFYQWKHKYIKHLIQTDNIAEVYESEKLYRFVLKSGNSLHQLKNQFPKGVTYETKQEDYIQETPTVVYDSNFVNNTILQIALLDVSEC